jgi:putative DNA primase/helicase
MDRSDLPPGLMLQAALDCAARGIPVFPCKPENKRPYIKGGFKSATTYPGLIRRWWRQWLDAMIGMPTGAVSGVFVLDVDVDEAKGKDGEASLMALTERHGPLPETVSNKTPRGGHHLFFRHPGPGYKVKNSAAKLGKVLDVRGDGGYVILPPSARPDGAVYRAVPGRAWGEVEVADAPEWLLRLVAEPDKVVGLDQERAKRHAAPKRSAKVRYVEQALIDELENVRNVPGGQRNDTLNRATFNLGQLVGAGVLDEARVRAALTAAAADLAAQDGTDSVAKTIELRIGATGAKFRAATAPRRRRERGSGVAPDRRATDGRQGRDLPGDRDAGARVRLSSRPHVSRHAALGRQAPARLLADHLSRRRR